MRLFPHLGKLGHDVRGATAIEYGLIVSLLVIAIVAAIASLGGQTYGLWGGMTEKVAAVQP